MLKATINLELIPVLYIIIFVILSPDSGFKSVICIRNSRKSVPIIMFFLRLKEGEIIYQNGLKGLQSSWSSILRPPKHRFMFFLFILNAK